MNLVTNETVNEDVRLEATIKILREKDPGGYGQLVRMSAEPDYRTSRCIEDRLTDRGFLNPHNGRPYNYVREVVLSTKEMLQ